MLNIKQIETFYPENLKPFKKNLLREYLQYKILEIIYDSKFGDKLFFMGGTAARIIHSNTRFSEDLDFDNRSLEKRDFEQLVMLVRRQLQLQGYAVETKNVFKGAFRSYLRIPDVLFENGISGHREEKMLIEIDAEPQEFTYRAEKVILNKFDVFLRINVVPVSILLSQKLYAIFMRKLPLGRDFFDAIFLFGKTKPNFVYLKLKLHITNMNVLRKKLLVRCKKFDFQRLAKEVEPFLFVPGDSKKVLYFCDYIKQLQ